MVINKNERTWNMAIKLMDLPYSKDALEPWMSKNTLDFHHDKHHKKYVDTLNELIKGTEYDKSDLEEIIQGSYKNEEQRKIFNNASQAWNHNFFWQCLTPKSDGMPDDSTVKLIEKSFGGMDEFKKKFSTTAAEVFGSGWAWLILDDGKLVIEGMSNAGNPISEGRNSILTCDVWEHAYYLDYQNERPKFLENFWKLVNWNFVAEQVELSLAKPSSNRTQFASESRPPIQ
jgi:Fe-Mn family superoxide dismutase